MKLTGMTYNLKYASEHGPHPWPARRPLVAEVLRRTAPALVATQEGLYLQLRDILADAGRYDWVGLGRGGGSRGEFAAILFDPTLLEPIEFDHFWLSDTPDLVGSRSRKWRNDNIRMATWVRFRATDGTEFVWLNTHLDNASERARRRGSALIARRLGRIAPPGLPAVVSGDFNAAPGSAAYRTLLDAGFADAWAVSREPPPDVGTYGGWGAPQPGGHRIDWVLVRGPVAVESATICDYHESVWSAQRWPSDHVPVVVRLRIG